MNALAEYMQKFGLNESSAPTELKIGQSFFNDGRSPQYHTVRYDFIPASVDDTKTSALEFGEKGKVTVTMPNLEGTNADTTESVYQGSRKPHMKECLLIINNETGELILEKLNTSVMVKKTRVRQEDLTGKSLALNRRMEHEMLNGKSLPSIKFPTLVSSSSSSSVPSSSSAYSSSSASQPKLLPNKSSPPFASGSPMLHKTNNSQPAQANRSAIVLPTLSRNSKTPSPPSMPQVFGTVNGQSSHQKGSSTSSSTASAAFASLALGANSKGPEKLSDDSSSDSSDDENDSSSSDSSSSDDDVPASKPVPNESHAPQPSQPSMPSMPSFLGKSMPSFLAKSKEVSPASTSNHSMHSVRSMHSVHSVHGNNSPAGNKPSSSKRLSLSEDSDSDGGWKGKNNKHSMPTLSTSNVMPSMPSMPSSFGSFGQKPAPPASMPTIPSINAKVDSVLNNDLQLSESSSDEDE